jgi:trehalose 6-phosphate phosphatase
MAATATRRGTTFQTFFRRLAGSPKNALLLDYDGTLAPFQPERGSAVPYSGIPDLLHELLLLAKTRVVIVSGRPAREIPPLLGVPLEVWGSHGMERLLPDGEYQVNKLDRRVSRAFENAAEQLASCGVQRHMEVKPGSVAVHWRGLESGEAREAHARAQRVLQPVAFSEGLALVNFDGGLELRVRTPTKADVVRTVLKEQNAHTPTAYLGDDLTDEDAFAALNPFGLTVLVRPEHRPTAARFWIRPPEELMSFLQNWLFACGGDYDFE